jgi:hypothetical protein
MKKRTLSLLITTLVCSAAMTSTPAFGAHPYRIDPGGAKATSSKTIFTLGEAGSFSCSEAVYKQPNPTEKELVAEEQGLIASYSGCTGTLGGFAAKITVGPEVNYKLSAREGSEAETKFKGILASLQKDMLLKVVSGSRECTVKMPAESNHALKEIQWTDLKTTPGERLSTFAMTLTGGHAISSGGTGCSELALTLSIVWILENFPTQTGES